MGKGTDVGAQIPGLGESLGGCLWPLFKVFYECLWGSDFCSRRLACLCIERTQSIHMIPLNYI